MELKKVSKKINRELDRYKKRINQKIESILPVFAKAAVGDFSQDVNTNAFKDDEFLPVLTGVQIMLEVVREKVKGIEEEFENHRMTWNYLIQTEKKYRNLFENINEGVQVVDLENIIRLVNPQFCKQTGYSESELIGKRSIEIFPEKKQIPFFGKNSKSESEESIKPYEVQLKTKSGDIIWFLVSESFVKDNDGITIGCMGIHTDITIKKKQEEELIHLSKAKDAIIANVSHEIRTPMNGIMGLVQLMEDTPTNELQKKYLMSIQFAGQNLLHIINDVLDISKIKTGKMKLENIDFCLKDVLEVIKDLFVYQAKEKGIDLLCKYDENIPPLLNGDPVRLNQILTNLLSNAIKFTEKGNIMLCIQSNGIDKDRISIFFSVKDTGIGIPSESIQKIFDMFEQVHKEHFQKYGGTGLGLSIVKQLIEMQGGKIEVTSKLTEGSEFSFELTYLIVNGIKFLKINPDDSNENCKLIGKKVLLVEDNKLNQMVADMFLKKWGMEVEIAENGAEAIDKFFRCSFDIVLMDIQMPEMNGYEATRCIRKKGTSRESLIPILAMTAHALSGEEEKCLSLGMNGYITKPLNRNLLKIKICEMIKKK